MWIIVGIFVLVFGVMTVAIVKHRKSVGHKAEQFHENTTVEIIWTIVPFVILIGMAYPATKTVIAMKDTSNPDITIKATGYQWKWGYDYLQEGISFYSNLATPRDQIDGHNDEARAKNPNYLLEVDNPVVVPVGKKVRIITTANDVIHAWWVPALGVKQDAIPGLRARHVVQGRPRRHLSRPVRRALRQGPRLHADRGRGRGAGEVRRSGSPRAEEDDAPAPRRGRSRQAVDARRAAARTARKCTRRTASPAIRRPAWACPARSPRLSGSKVVDGPEGRADQHRAERQARHRDGAVQAPVRRRTSRRSSPTRATTGRTRPATWSTPAEVKAQRK